MLLNISLSNGIARQSEIFERKEGFKMHREKGGGGTNVAWKEGQQREKESEKDVEELQDDRMSRGRKEEGDLSITQF